MDASGADAALWSVVLWGQGAAAEVGQPVLRPHSAQPQTVCCQMYTLNMQHSAGVTQLTVVVYVTARMRGRFRDKWA